MRPNSRPTRRPASSPARRKPRRILFGNGVTDDELVQLVVDIEVERLDRAIECHLLPYRQVAIDNALHLDLF